MSAGAHALGIHPATKLKRHSMWSVRQSCRRLPLIPRAATRHSWCTRRSRSWRAPTNDDDQALGAHVPTVANGARDAGAIGYCLGPCLRPRLHAAFLPDSARGPCLASASPAARRPFTPTCCAADTAISQPPAGPCANARSTVAPEIRVHVRPGQDQLGHVELLPQLRDPVRSPPRGCHAAGRSRRIGRRIGQRFCRERLGHSVGCCLTGMAHWLRGPKVRALGGVAGRTCAAVRGASVLASSQLSCRVVYFCCSPARRPLEMSPHHERNLLCEVR